MATKSIGSLFIDIAARTAQLEKDMDKVRNILKGTGKDTEDLEDKFNKRLAAMEKSALKFGAAMLGAQSVMRLVAKEVRNVVENIEDIPGLPDSVTQGVETFRHNIYLANLELKQGLAIMIAWAQQAMSTFGAGFSNMVNAAEGRGPGDNTPTVLTEDMMNIDRMGNTQFNKQVKKGGEKVTEAFNAAQRKGLDYSHEMVQLDEDMLAKWIEIGRATGDTLKQDELKVQAYNLLGKQKELEFQMTTKIAALAEKDGAVVKARSDIFENAQTRLNDLLARRNQLQTEEADLSFSLKDPLLQVRADVQQKLLKIKQEELTVDEKINVAMKKNGEIYHQLGTAIAQDFTEAILKGEKLGDVLKNLLHDIEAIILKKMVTEPLGNFATAALTTIFGFAGGGDPPVGEPSVVGENGPELFVPKTAGTIIPNGEFSGAMAGAGGGGDTYYIDARSADRTGLENLYAYIRKVNGSIEPRSVAAMNSFNRRRA